MQLDPEVQKGCIDREEHEQALLAAS